MMMNWVRRVVPLPVKKRATDLLCHPLVGRAVSWVFADRIPSWGCRIFVDSPRVSMRQRAEIFTRLYERAEIALIRRYLEPDVDVVELGGSIGVGASCIARTLRPDRRLVVVEADPELAPILERNLQENAGGTHFDVVRKAFYAASQPVDRVRLQKGSNNLSGKVERELGEDSGDAASWIPVTNLSDLVQEYGIGEYTLVSDIEGAELGLFLNDAKALEGCRRIIAEIDSDEFEGRYYSIDAVIAMARDLGFELQERYFNCVVLQRRAAC